MTRLSAITQTLAAKTADFATTTEGHHHLSPAGWLDYAITGVGVVIVAYVIYVAIDRTFRPRETASDHIKRRILEEHG